MKNINTLVNDQDFIKKVQYILIALFIILIALDIYLALDKTDNNTISNVILQKTDNGLFVLTYFWGVIAANLFITKKSPKAISPLAGTVIVLALAILIILFNIEPKMLTALSNFKYNISVYSFSMVLGFLVGYAFWRQKS